MTLFRFLLCLFAFIGSLAAAGALVMSVLLMLRFPPLLVAVLLACWLLHRLLKMLRTTSQGKTVNDTATPQ